MKSFFLIITAAVLFGSSVHAQRAERQILSVLEMQERAWNKGNIKKYMSGYWHSDSVVFISKNKTTYGWQKVYKNYKKNYPSKKSMGTLSFSEIKITSIIQGQYFTTGKWFLKRDSGDIGGNFHLVWKKINDKWVIVMDYTT